MSALAIRCDPSIRQKTSPRHVGHNRREAPKWDRGAHWSIIMALIKRREDLAMSQADVDRRVGWAEGYCGKLEAGMRRPGIDVLYEWMAALKCEIVILPR